MQKLFAKWSLTYGNQFRQYRCTLTSIIRAAKENLYKNKLRDTEGDARKSWEILNSIMGRKSGKNHLDFVSFSNHVIYDHQENAESLSEYFGGLANRLASNIQQLIIPFTSYLPESTPSSFFLQPSIHAEVKTMFDNLKSTAAGFDNIHVKVINKSLFRNNISISCAYHKLFLY